MPTLQELITQALRAKNVGAVKTDPYGKAKAGYDYATEPPELLKSAIARLPKSAQSAAGMVTPSRADLLTMGGSTIGAGLGKLLTGGTGAVKKAVLGTGMLRRAVDPFDDYVPTPEEKAIEDAFKELNDLGRYYAEDAHNMRTAAHYKDFEDAVLSNFENLRDTYIYEKAYKSLSDVNKQYAAREIDDTYRKTAAKLFGKDYFSIE
jgi:hypothetical protein